MKRLEVVQIGLGHVGRAVVQMVLEERKHWRERYGLEVVYRAVSDTTGGVPVGAPIQRRSASRGAIDRARAIEEGNRANRHRARRDEAPEARASHWARRGWKDPRSEKTASMGPLARSTPQWAFVV